MFRRYYNILLFKSILFICYRYLAGYIPAGSAVRETVNAMKSSLHFKLISSNAAVIFLAEEKASIMNAYSVTDFND